MPRRLTAIGAALLVAFASIAGSACGSSHEAQATCESELGKLTPVTDYGTARATGSTIAVAGAQAGFTPTCITDVPRGTVTLTMRNTGTVVHDIGVPAQRVEADARPGRSVSIRLRVGSEPVVFVCRIHRSLGMVGVLLPAAG